MTEPATAERHTLAFTVLAVALTALGVAPLWLVDLLPLVDAASHVHLITILHDIERNPLLQKHYLHVDAIVPYLTYYKAVDWLAWLMPDGPVLTAVEQANRVVLSLCLIALPLSALSLLRAAGHSRWLLLGVFPWMLNADFFMGFLNFLMSIPIFLWLLAAHLRFLQRPSWLRAAGVAGLLGLLATTHYLLWAVGLALLPLLALIYGVRNGWRRTLLWPIRELALGVPSILVLLPWFLKYFVFAEGVTTSDVAQPVSGGLLARLSRVYAGEHLGPIENLRQVADHLFDAVGARDVGPNLWLRPGELASTLWLVGLALWVVGAVRQAHTVQPGTQPPPRSAIVVSGSSYTGWALCLTAAMYFVFPVHLIRPIWLYGVNFRLVEVLAVLAVVALPLRPLAPPVTARWRVWGGTLAMVAAGIVLPLATAQSFLLARTEYGHVREAFAQIPKGKAVMTLRSKRESQWFRYHIFNNIHEFYGMFGRGYVPYSFADTSSKPVVVRKDRAYPAPPWDVHNAFGWREHGRFYDYLVLYNEIGAPPAPYEAELPHWLEPVYRRGHWRVFRNPLPDEYPEPTDTEWTTRARARVRRAIEADRVRAVLHAAGLLPVLARPGQLADPLSDLAVAVAQAAPWGLAPPTLPESLQDLAVAPPPVAATEPAAEAPPARMEPPPPLLPGLLMPSLLRPRAWPAPETPPAVAPEPDLPVPPTEPDPAAHAAPRRPTLAPLDR